MYEEPLTWGNIDLYGVLFESTIPVAQYGKRVGRGGSNQQRIWRRSLHNIEIEIESFGRIQFQV